MARYNTQFELSLEDMELIETALREAKKSLSLKMLDHKCRAARDDVRGIHDLLGRLHNQKEFYRPKTAAYVGG